jgi:transposase-like protein
VIPAKAADESTIRLLLAVSQQESLTVYTDGFRAYRPLEEDNAFDHKSVVHGDGEYADGEVHVNTCERRLKGQADAVSQSITVRRDLLRKVGYATLRPWARRNQ